MSLWKTYLKRSVLAVTAAAIAVSWTRTGQAQAPCIVGRGQDPLDVVNSGVKHNVWIVVDTSGSMGDDMNGGNTRPTKIETARDVLKEAVDEFVDASGKPLVNWGIVSFAANASSNSTECNVQFPSGPPMPNGYCSGLQLNELVAPPPCSAPSNANQIKNELNAMVISGGNPRRGGNTPNGMSMDQISKEVVNRGYVTGLLPNQKNFILLVTDGDDTCECELSGRNSAGRLVGGVWTPTPLPPYAASNTIPKSLRGGTANWNYTIPVTTDAGNIAAINAGTKGRLAYERLNPTAADRTAGAKGQTFIIGVGLAGIQPSRTHHIAWEASGAFYSNPKASYALMAANRVALKNALRDAFAKIGVPASTVTLGSPTVGTVREVIPSHTNGAITPPDHVGDVGPIGADGDDIRAARTVRANHQNNVLFSSSVDIPGFKGHFTAHNIYRVTDPQNARTARQADFTQLWDAGQRLQLRAPDTRNILFNRRGDPTLRPFTTGAVTPADLGVGVGYLNVIDGVGALTANDARDMVVGVVRGFRLSKHPTTGTLYAPGGAINFSGIDQFGQPTWKLYDAIGAPAVVGNPPRSPDFDPPQNHATKYGVGGKQAGEGFYWDHFNRQTMVYLPTNGGMMHAFNAQTGDEVFAYIPDDAIGLAPGEVAGSRDLLADFVALVVAENNGIANHQFFLSGSPSVQDAFLRSDFTGDDDWHTILSFGRGRGGRFVSALDVTDPLVPKLRFNVGNREGLNDSLLDGLGETWSTPVMGNVATDNPSSSLDRTDQWLAFLGGGYGCSNASLEGQYLYALRLEDGSVYHRAQVTNDPTAAIPYNAVVAMPALYNPHAEDVADGKDYVSRVYVGDLQGRIWKLVTTSLSPTGWTFGKFAEVGLDQPITTQVALLDDPNNQQVYVMAGTGGDVRVSSAGSTFKFVALKDIDAEGASTTQYPLGSPAFWSRNLLSGERVYVTPVTIGEMGDGGTAMVFFAASNPGFSVQTCSGFFTSSLYALGIVSGAAEVDLDGSGADASVNLGDSKVAGLYARDGNLFVSKSGGLGSAGSLSVYGDGDFSDDIQSGGNGITIQVLVDSFRISPF
jgi:hypothetical protein